MKYLLMRNMGPMIGRLKKLGQLMAEHQSMRYEMKVLGYLK